MPRRPLPGPHELYELCVQDAPRVAAWITRRLGAERARTATLGEDFCGTAAVARSFLEGEPRRRAIVIDREEAVLRRIPQTEGLQTLQRDLASASALPPVDVIHVGNFSLGTFRERSDLDGYLEEARRRLRPGGIFLADLYGGASAHVLGHSERRHRHPAGHTVDYTWEQRHFDALTGHVEVVLHFELRAVDGRRISYPDAFVYPWRLWSLSELRDALHGAGFSRVAVVDRTDGLAEDAAEAAELPESYVVLLVAEP